MSTPTLKTGYTTGTCATAASQAAGIFLLHGQKPEHVEIELPCGETARLAIQYYRKTEHGALAAVKKDSGDDPDITHGCIIEAEVSLLADTGDAVEFSAGKGVGTITRPGLQLPPGNAAINPVPRQMITDALLALQHGKWQVTISVIGGEQLAQKTFNPKLGIVGGISIIGTSGIVRPFSHKAIEDTVRCSLDVAAASNVRIPILVAGHYGESAARTLYPQHEEIITVSNCWDVALSECKRHKFERIIIVGHAGKLAKFCSGHFNTHSNASPPALGDVVRLADRLQIPHGHAEDLSENVLDDSSPMNPSTVEGFFSLLSRGASEKLANTLAKEIAAAAEQVCAIPVELTLINMSKKVIGRYPPSNSGQ